MRKVILFLIIAVATGCLWFVVASASHKITVRTYFQNAQDLIPGARVRVDGLDAGFVRNLKVVAGDGKRLVVVRMALDTRNAPSVPSDATTSIQADGVLGPTFVEVDTRNKTGAPIANDGVLQSSETADNTGTARALEVIGTKLIEESKKLREKENSQSPKEKSQ